MTLPRSVVVFDLGGVLIDWNPRYLYRKLFNGDDAAMEHFLATVCTSSWNLQQDAGRPFAEACATLKLEHPKHAEFIDAWFERHTEMISGPIQGTVEILAELRARQVPLYALTNWSAETFPSALRRFDFLHWFQGILVSGNVQLIKPDPRIFELFFRTHGVEPEQTIYIDDLPRNVEAASRLGMHGIVFTNPRSLRSELVKLGLVDPPQMNSVGRVDHVAAWVSDLERARAFYERWFKAKAGSAYSSSSRDFQSYFLSLGTGARIELMTSPAEPARPAHVAISVGSREAVDRMVQEMSAEGVQIVSPPRVTGDGYYEAVVADSEGNLLEITA
ncbi:MAG: HAD-IA family hydrolase [Candidatus Sulfotelmatobacter sp.]|jgi:2-haloacid dehalogenase